MSSYVKISEFGKPAAYAPVNNPLSYGLSGGMDNLFMHGSKNIDSNALPFQTYAAEYCAKGFDNFCKVMTANQTPQYFPNLVHGCTGRRNTMPEQLTQGDVILLNTARVKYLMKMRNSVANMVPFDPTVAASPLITIYTGEYMIPEYHIPKGHDLKNDPVMQRLLNKPMLGLELLLNIYSNMKSQNRLGDLKGTKLGMFYDNLIKNASKGKNSTMETFELRAGRRQQQGRVVMGSTSRGGGGRGG
jgi:hypothetical protein